MELIQAVKSALVMVTVVTSILCKAPHHLELQEEDCAARSVYYMSRVTFSDCGVLCPRGQSVTVLLLRVEMENSIA